MCLTNTKNRVLLIFGTNYHWFSLCKFVTVMWCINDSFLDYFLSVALAFVNEALFKGLKEVFQRLDGLETGLKSQGKQNNFSL